MSKQKIDKQTGNKPELYTLLLTVQLGTKLIAGNTICTVVKKYNDFVWRLKTEKGEYVNVFYALDQTWKLHCL